MKILKESELSFRQLKSKNTGEDYSLSGAISEQMDLKDLFFSVEIVRPGSRSSAPHFHARTEELIYVLSGSVTAIEGQRHVEMEKGDSICFEANSGKAHFLRNDSSSEARVLVVRRHLEESDVSFS